MLCCSGDISIVGATGTQANSAFSFLCLQWSAMRGWRLCLHLLTLYQRRPSDKRWWQYGFLKPCCKKTSTKTRNICFFLKKKYLNYIIDKILFILNIFYFLLLCKSVTAGWAHSFCFISLSAVWLVRSWVRWCQKHSCLSLFRPALPAVGSWGK